MGIVEQLSTSFLASVAFGIIFNAPKASLAICGLVGMAGWMIYFLLVQYQVEQALATLAGAFFVAVFSQFFSRKYKTPSIIFSVMGIIPLVPGGLSYDAMRNFVENDYSEALQLAARAFMISGAIAFGLVFSEVINQLIKRRKLR
ncbi:threonine/serine exporter family protein [Ammoniphilus sp. 3BR4]|uniref:threonine/serine exporter family protein n=1 Tax=Ammoniphilus sp. 3BR4 TaxID=3158265 RepID=UPI003465208F